MFKRIKAIITNIVAVVTIKMELLIIIISCKYSHKYETFFFSVYKTISLVD